MNSKNYNPIYAQHYSRPFPIKSLNLSSYKVNGEAICCSLNLKKASDSMEEFGEFDCFKDDNLRVQGQGGRRPYMERAGISLFRKHKRIKWLEMLSQEKEPPPLYMEDSSLVQQQKIAGLPRNADNLANRTIALNHRSTSQAVGRQIYTSLQNRRERIQKVTKKTASAAKLYRRKHESSLDKITQQKYHKQQQQMRFQILAKPMSNRLQANPIRRTKEELKQIYSPSKIFHKSSKSSREPISSSEEANLFKAWQLSQEDIGNEFQDYTQQLFSCQTLELGGPVRFPHKNVQVRRK